MTTMQQFAIAAAAIITVLGFANNSISADTDENEVVGLETYCEIKAVKGFRGVTLRGQIHANDDVRGFYQLLVESSSNSGNTSLSQGGAFKAQPGEHIRVGKMVLGGRDIAYYATLTVDIDGKTHICRKSNGASI